ncbi:hypothetical protein [Parvibaculum sp. MBR-TMA-1.3b-4.2]
MIEKVAIIYHFYELNETYRDNFVFFMNTAVDDTADYFVFISGDCSVPLTDHENVKYIQIKNKNHDFGGVVEFVRQFNHLSYDAYMFVNSSMRGPFVPTYFSMPWYDGFLSRLSDTIVMVGCSVNILPMSSSFSVRFGDLFDYEPPFIHVQTTAYALSSKAFKHLVAAGFYDVEDFLEKEDVIARYEIGISQEVLKQGWSISSLLPQYEEFNTGKRSLGYEDTLREGDPLFENAFFGRSICPLETIFIKTNRNMIKESDLNSFTFTSLSTREKSGGLDQAGRELLNRSHRMLLESTRTG